MSSTATPRRVQLRRTAGWRKPEGAVVVARPSRWGNPYRVETIDAEIYLPGIGTLAQAMVTHLDDPTFVDGPYTIDQAHRVAIEGYVKHLATSRLDVAARRELRGLDLCCWCPPQRPCHADVLLWLANGRTPLLLRAIHFVESLTRA